MANRWTQEAYEYALRMLIKDMKNPPRTPSEMHAVIAKKQLGYSQRNVVYST